ncbi:hypothetical protein NHX12_003115 [Muraenolepis orangiensis]|uniref:exodeoxyribonuclease III n=1 Tax=Muraenolepis orangiensis TaxID=630683 RepID=A0A9Q0IGX1_9TELE|nr:hypothetical protein NHX12_003115 [Muraenolepis orangiensis]
MVSFLALQTSGGKTVVFFDLKTTGLASTCDIIQLAAVSGEHSINRYMVPEAAIDPDAAGITGFSVQDGVLLHWDTAVPTVPLREALTSFLTFLSSLGGPVLLAAHNGKRFDAPILTRQLLRCSLMQQFQQLASMFMDTFLLKTTGLGGGQGFVETSGGKTVVFFDLETTGLDSTCDIIQLAAVSGERSFNSYMVPKAAIDREAADITGFRVQDSVLLQGGRPVPTVPLREALTSFLTFLSSLGGPVLLAAHNGKRFDAPILTRQLRRCSLMQQFQQLGSMFMDTFLLSKNLYPMLDSYSQVNLVKHFLGKPYNAHNALEDSRVLQELYRCWNPIQTSVSRVTF